MIYVECAKDFFSLSFFLFFFSLFTKKQIFDSINGIQYLINDVKSNEKIHWAIFSDTLLISFCLFIVFLAIGMIWIYK